MGGGGSTSPYLETALVTPMLPCLRLNDKLSFSSITLLSRYGRGRVDGTQPSTGRKIRER